MAKKRVFISFDYDNDSEIKILLAGQAKLPDSPFDFKDASIKEHLTGDWKEKVRRRMDNIDKVIFLCGTKTDKATGVAAELEIVKECGIPYFFLAGYKDKKCVLPQGAWIFFDTLHAWTWDNLKRQIG